ncbi:hypothetical protein OBK27_04355 [Empedobacter falsenii]
MKELENSNYNLIGKIAIALYGQDITISLDALKQILNDHGANYKPDGNVGIGQSVAAAYRAWRDVDPVIHHAIAHVFVGRDGKKPWEKY